MNKDDRYTLTVYLAAPGTPLKDGGSSMTGHMYVQLEHDATTISYGLQPDSSGPPISEWDRQLGSVRGGVSNRDSEQYLIPTTPARSRSARSSTRRCRSSPPLPPSMAST